MSFLDTSVLPLTTELFTKLQFFRTSKGFNAQEFITKRSVEISDFMLAHNKSSAIVSVSGGIDSAVTLGLLLKAQEHANNNPTHPFNSSNNGKIIPVAQPCYSTIKIQQRAYELCTLNNLSICTLDLGETFDMFNRTFAHYFETQPEIKEMSSMKNYLRVPYLIFLAGTSNGLVWGSTDKTDYFLNSYNKFGDGAHDANCTHDLFKSEIYQVAQFLNIPQSILEGTPTRDLYRGQNDESDMGMSHDAVELAYYCTYKMNAQELVDFENGLDDESKNIYKQIFYKVRIFHWTRYHKSDLNPVLVGWYGGCEHSGSPFDKVKIVKRDLTSVLPNPTVMDIRMGVCTTMSEDMYKKLFSLRAITNFNIESFVNKRALEICQKMKDIRKETAIISVSGGIDSAVVSCLLSKALEYAKQDEHNPFRKIIAIAQPCESTESIQSRAFELCDYLKINIIQIDLTCAYTRAINAYKKEFNLEPVHIASASMKSHLRTGFPYFVANCLNGVVYGTGNRDEDGLLYYFSKYGDGAVDFGVIWDLHKSQVFQVGEYLGVPSSILSAPPSADLYPNQTDETELGVSYDAVELVDYYVSKFDDLTRAQFIGSLNDKMYEEFVHYFDVVEKTHRRNYHKHNLNPTKIG